MHFWDKKKRFAVVPGDVVICWGASIPELEGVHVLNSMQAPLDKFKELETLYHKNVRCISHTKSDPGEMGDSLMPRSVHHVGGLDLLSPMKTGDYFVYKDDFINEYRIHSFNGKSIRAGIKVVRDGFTLVPNASDWKPNANLAHPWVKSYEGGWRVSYDGFASTPALRKLAKSAVAALGLTFGAVDIGERRTDGRLVVFEVNRAPGIEGGSTASYVRAITKWLKGEEKPDED